MRLAKLSRIPSMIILFGYFAAQTFGIEATTNPVGVIQVTALGDSDTLVSLPLKQPAVFNGVVNSVSGADLTAEGSPGWAGDEWADSYYAFMRSGAAAGAYATILSNTANTLTLDVVSLEVDGPVATDSFSIHPFWTLDSLFPQGAGVHESPEHVDRQTELFFPSFAEGINLAAEATYYYIDGVFNKVGATLGVDYGGTIILPDSYFILRNNITTSTTVTFTGEVVMGDLSLPVIFQDQSEQDNIIGLQRPIEMTLDESGLSATFETGDQLLVWDHATADQNRLISSATIYTWDGAKWVKDGGVDDAGGDMVFTPGRGFIIRKAIAGEVDEDDWVNNPNYGN
ncbi:MAG: TIGR02597 family protein [Verrucomicrobia bacterium]|nr:TIGR02597 family protein [Verrucomicrobiota bacterium]